MNYDDNDKLNGMTDATDGQISDDVLDALAELDIEGLDDTTDSNDPVTSNNSDEIQQSVVADIEPDETDVAGDRTSAADVGENIIDNSIPTPVEDAAATDEAVSEPGSDNVETGSETEEAEDETIEFAPIEDEVDPELEQLNAEEDAAFAEQMAEDEAAVDELEHQLSEMEGAGETKGRVHYPEYFDENMPDTQERADRICVSIDVDDFGRDIIEPVFENVLRQSKNTLKLHYSRIKNEILKYRDVAQLFSPEDETFYYRKKPLLRLEFKGGKLSMLLALKPEDIDKECAFAENGSDSKKDLPVRILINAKYIDGAIELVNKLAKKRKIPKLKAYAPTAYAERYPFNSDAVLRGKEKRPPVEGEFDGDEYTPVMGELVKGAVAKNLAETEILAKEQLLQIRESAAALKDAVSAVEPIAFFYDTAVRTEDNTVAFINSQQVLNDKFLGRLLPQQFFAVAETSNRIEKLNLMHLEAVVNECNANPEILFVMQISVRFLVDPALISTLLEKSVTENRNLILAFDGIMLEKTGEMGQNSLKKLMDNGVYIMLDNGESISARALVEMPFDYLRFDSRVYNRENVKATNHLDIMLEFCKNSNIITVARYVDMGKQKRYFLDHKVDVMQGDAICAPSRLTSVALVTYHKI